MMKLALLSLFVVPSYAFQAVLKPYRQLSTSLGITSDEILKRARASAGVAEEEAPQIFEPEILKDMQSALLKMEKRVKEGPLTFNEVDQLEMELTRIVQEMKLNPHKRLPKPSPEEKEANRQADANYDPPSPIKAEALSAPSPVATKPQVMDTSQDEGPVYDGTGGMGQPKGTLNTYTIPGMDEMTPEEYRKALDQSIIDRATERRYSGQPNGNRATWNYMESLGSPSGVLKKKTDE